MTDLGQTSTSKLVEKRSAKNLDSETAVERDASITKSPTMT